MAYIYLQEIEQKELSKIVKDIIDKNEMNVNCQQSIDAFFKKLKIKQGKNYTQAVKECEKIMIEFLPSSIWKDLLNNSAKGFYELYKDNEEIKNINEEKSYSSSKDKNLAALIINSYSQNDVRARNNATKKLKKQYISDPLNEVRQI